MSNTMSWQPHKHEDAGLGATFIPGGFDDYYMPAAPPELVSPAPQRIMPEVPENIQENLAHLELEANPPRGASQGMAPWKDRSTKPAATADQTSSTYQNQHPQSFQQLHQRVQQHNGLPHAPVHTASAPVIAAHGDLHMQNGQTTTTFGNLPTFSPFPKLQNRPPNVPETDDEKEATLENARLPVLNSNDPEMQLVWAQDVLAYVEVAMKYEQRLLGDRPRPATPQVQHQLRIDAMNIVSFLAEQHHPIAEFIKGMWLEFGKFGIRMDKREAFWCYSRAADKGYARAEYRIGHQYESCSDIPNALRHYHRGMESGDSAATYRLGMMTLLGQHGQYQDYGRGIQMIKQAAENADDNAPQAAYVYGMLLVREIPTINIPEMYLPYDEQLARFYIEEAASHGFAKAQVKMGSAYELCALSCEFNPTLSLHYNALAARQGEPEAEMAISKWFLCGYEGLFQKNEEIAYTYAHRAAMSGLATAQFAMGYYNEVGVYCTVNMEKALEWYQKAAKGGNADAPSRIKSISQSKVLSKKDHEEVAISRIKSQYGSQKGKRPERFKAQTTHLPQVPDSPVEYANPANPQVQNGLQQPVNAHGNAATPSRATNSTPYPLEDRPATTAPYISAVRPASVAPYPLEDGPPKVGLQRPGPAGGFFATNVHPLPEIPSARPASAFAVNPSIHSASAYPDTSGLNGQRPYPHSGLAHGPQRPYSSMADLTVSGRKNVGQRIVSETSGGQIYRQPNGPSIERPGSDRPQAEIAKPITPRIDIGYSAPVDVHIDRINKLRKAGANPSESRQDSRLRQHHSPTTPSQAAKPLQNHTRGESPHQRLTADGRQSPSPNTRLGPAVGYPPRHDSIPVKPVTTTSLPSGAPATSTRPPRTDSGASSKPAPHPDAVPPRPPGQGPKTFEEMGVPKVAPKGDCVVM